MNGRDIDREQRTTDISPIPTNSYSQQRKATLDRIREENEGDLARLRNKQKKSEKGGMGSFLYDPRRKTVLGRSALGWAKLAAFYTIFYICLGCFFLGLLYVFAQMIDRTVPRYYNTESTMAVRTSATVVGMGFRPQPVIGDNLIRITDNFEQQKRIASSLRLYRDVYLIQKAEAKTDVCSAEEPAADLPQGVACLFNWFHIVDTPNHPCSDNNLYGFAKEEPCVIVKLNKVYDWTPSPGITPVHIQRMRGRFGNKTVALPDVYITCAGSNPLDRDALNDMIYYSLGDSSGSPQFGVIPNYFFPYRNAPDHVQPFVLVQFKNLPLHRLISVTCKAWAPEMQHDTRGMRGMVSFQLYRAHKELPSKDNL